MVVGDGLLANAFSSYGSDSAVTIFAAGVSNSGETRVSEFERETSVIVPHAIKTAGCLVYFSTCSVNYLATDQSPYVRHKLAVERLITKYASEYLVFRLPQVVGRTPNPNTLTNYMFQRIVKHEPIVIFADATRSLLDVDDAYIICKSLIDTAPRNKIYNVHLPYTISALDLLRTFERVLNTKADYQIRPGGQPFFCEDDSLASLYASLGLKCDGYVENVLRKYYGRK